MKKYIIILIICGIIVFSCGFGLEYTKYPHTILSDLYMITGISSIFLGIVAYIYIKFIKK